MVTFTCTLPGSLIRWKIIPPEDQGPSFRLTLIFTSNGNVAVTTEGNPAFRGVLTDFSGGMLTATLTSLSEASIVEGTMVLCEGTSSQEGPLTITVAGEWLACTLSLYQSTHRSTLPSTESKGVLNTKPTQLLYYHFGVGTSFSNWCVYQVCPHHLPNTCLRVTSQRGDHLDTDNRLLQHTLQCDYQTVNCAGMSNDVMMVIPSIG